jgi:hypothetical protein
MATSSTAGGRLDWTQLEGLDLPPDVRCSARPIVARPTVALGRRVRRTFPAPDNGNGYFDVAVAGSRAFAVPAAVREYDHDISAFIRAPGIAECGLVHVYNLDGLERTVGIHAGLRNPKAVAAIGASEIVVADLFTGFRFFAAADGTPTRALDVLPLGRKPLGGIAATTERIYAIYNQSEAFDGDDPDETGDDGGDSIMVLSLDGEHLQHRIACPRTTNAVLSTDGLYISRFYEGRLSHAVVRFPFCA